MSFSSSEFENNRPWLFHLTSQENWKVIRRVRVLRCCSDLAALSGNAPSLVTKRRNHVGIVVNGDPVLLRDQMPLHAGNISFEGGWSLQDVIRDLNGRVFFWPGNSRGPISYGSRHFERYQRENPIIIRVSTRELFAANSNSPEFCRFNSGSPRCSKGKGSPRGANTFLTGPVANFTSSKVVEVTFRNQVMLPSQVEYAVSPSGPWLRL
jgi:hypothetical protein